MEVVVENVVGSLVCLCVVLYAWHLLRDPRPAVTEQAGSMHGGAWSEPVYPFAATPTIVLDRIDGTKTVPDSSHALFVTLRFRGVGLRRILDGVYVYEGKEEIGFCAAFVRLFDDLVARGRVQPVHASTDTGALETLLHDEIRHLLATCITAECNAVHVEVRVALRPDAAWEDDEDTEGFGFL